MSDTNTLNDFYQVPGLSFDISKLRQDLDKILKKIKISNFRNNQFSRNTNEHGSW